MADEQTNQAAEAQAVSDVAVSPGAGADESANKQDAFEMKRDAQGRVIIDDKANYTAEQIRLMLDSEGSRRADYASKTAEARVLKDQQAQLEKEKNARAEERLREKGDYEEISKQQQKRIDELEADGKKQVLDLATSAMLNELEVPALAPLYALDFDTIEGRRQAAQFYVKAVADGVETTIARRLQTPPPPKSNGASAPEKQKGLVYSTMKQ